MSKPKICSHIGKLHPKNFDCIDCSDTADKCNCHDCMGTFCNKCNAIVWVLNEEGKPTTANCQDIVEAWDKVRAEGKRKP